MDSSFSHAVSRCELHYAAFRAAFLTTLDCLLRDSLEPSKSVDDSCGFLDRIPFLSSTAPQIQLECLFRTWHRPADQLPTLIDQCVIYAATEMLAELCKAENQPLLAMIWQGPRTLQTAPDMWLLSKIRAFQVMFPTVAAIALPCRFTEVRTEQRMQAMTSCDMTEDRSYERDMEGLIRLLGRWRMNREVLVNTGDLLTSEEQDILRAFFEEHPRLFE